MIKLYTFPECRYCEKVRMAFQDIAVKYVEIDASSGLPGHDELMSLGGRGQVPFLFDEEAGVKMYESNDIINYARERFTQN